LLYKHYAGRILQSSLRWAFLLSGKKFNPPSKGGFLHFGVLKMSEQQLEQEIQAKGLTAPRITPEHIDACIVKEQYHVFEGTTVTVCLLHLPNGFTVDGISACASPENFDPEIGRKIARQNAREKIWAFEGYLLKQQLHESHLIGADA